MIERDLARGVIAPHDAGFAMSAVRLLGALKLGGQVYELGDERLQTIAFADEINSSEPGVFSITMQDNHADCSRTIIAVDVRSTKRTAKWELDLATSTLTYTIASIIKTPEGEKTSEHQVERNDWIAHRHLGTVLDEMARRDKEHIVVTPDWLAAYAGDLALAS